MVIPKTAPNPDGAYAWMEFMLQPEIAAKLTERLSFATTNQAAIAKLPEALRSNVSLFPPMELLEKSESILPMEREALEAYDRYWTKLTSS
jgi:spermidine/putrescine transport system substrate-binding protein